MAFIPKTLIFSRVLIGAVMIWLSALHIPHYSGIAVTLLSIGLLTDIFDGIIARRLGVSTPALRRLDSSADQVFYLSVAVATYLGCPAFFKAHAVSIGLLLGTEALAYVISFIRFRKEVATHAIGSKVWSLILFATLIQVMLSCQAPALFPICLYTGLLTRLEIIAILLLLRQWTNDVPSVYHAILLRQGKAIKRHKLFNG